MGGGTRRIPVPGVIEYELPQLRSCSPPTRLILQDPGSIKSSNTNLYTERRHLLSEWPHIIIQYFKSYFHIFFAEIFACAKKSASSLILLSQTLLCK